MLTNAERECLAAPKGYALPAGWTWERVAMKRAEWDIEPTYLPLVSCSGATAWGVPLIDGKPARHRLQEFA